MSIVFGFKSDVISLSYVQRGHEREISEAKAPKTVKMEAPPSGPVSVAKMPDGMSPGQLTTLQIKEMMANAQRMIEERKKALEKLGTTALPPPGVVVPQVVIPPPGPAQESIQSRSEAAADSSGQVFDGELNQATR